MAFLDLFRKKQQQKAVSRRQYDGVNTGRLFSDFVTSERSADSELRFALKVLRNRSRDLSVNNEYVRRYFELLKINVIGDKGIQFQSKAVDSIGNLDQTGNQSVENAFKMWGKCGYCTVDGKLSWIDAQKLAVELMAKDGEAFIVKHRNAAFRDSFALEFIEADQIDDQLNKKLGNGREIRMGVELDRFKRPVAYHQLQYHPGDFDYATNTKSEKYKRIPAENVIHLYKQLRPGQTRGEPWLTPAITAIKQLGAFREAAVVNARVGASKMGFFTSPSGDGFVADDYDGQTPIISAEPGTFHNLPTGVNFVDFQPTFPSNDFDSFHKSILKGIASGLGVSYTSLSNDLEATSYSSIRQGALEERDFYKNVTQFVIDHFVRAVFDSWLGAAMEVGSFGIPLRQYDRFSAAAEFRGRGFSWVDPQKEMNAAISGLQSGILPLNSVAAQYGMDTEELLSQISRDRELAEQFGVEYSLEPFGAVRKEEDDEDDDGERGLNQALAESLKRCFVED